MGYSLHGANLRRELHELRWKFAKGQEYPEFGMWHPNLLIEDAIDELAYLEKQLEDERKARMARTDADFARKSQKYREDKAKYEQQTRA